MYEAVQVGTGHIEPVVVLGCEAMHQLMLFDLYGHPTDRAEEIHRITMEMLDDVPSPVFQVQKGFGAQLFGDESSVHEVLHRFGSRPDRLLRSMTGDHLLRVFGDTVARAGATTYAGPVYRALLPYAGLLNVGGGHSAGLPVDDVLGRLAALDGDVRRRGPPRTRRRRPRPLDAVAAAARALPRPPRRRRRARRATARRTWTRRAARRGRHPRRCHRRCRAARPGRARRRASSDPRDRPAMRRDGPHVGAHFTAGQRPVARQQRPRGNWPGCSRRPGVEVTAVELAGARTPRSPPISVPRLDAEAKRAYRRRLLELQAEVDDAETANDLVRG